MNNRLPDVECAMTAHVIGEQHMFRLSDYIGSNVVLFFYPKDSTPGCTTESMGFRDAYDHFKQCNTLVFGISRDPLKSHDRFRTNLELPYPLISDTQELLCAQFDVIKQKMMYGKSVRGIERSTFLINKEGIVEHEWRKVKVEQHVREVLEHAQRLHQSSQ